MNTEIISAIIGATATLIAGLLVIFNKRISGSIQRKSMQFPDIGGKWKAKWYIDGDKEPYLEDIVIIKVKGFQIYGKGGNIHKGEYQFKGKFYRNMIANLIYEYSDSNISLSGVITFRISPRGKKCIGKWYGYTKEDTINGGNLIWERTL